MYRGAAAVAALLLASSVAAAEAISVVESRALALTAGPDATHQLTLHAYTFRGTRWRDAEIAEALAAAAKLLTQCRVGIAGAELHVVQAPARFHNYSTPVSRELLRSLNVPKPAVFFVEDTHNEPAFDAETIGLSNSKTRPELANTIWVAHGARDLPFAIAHELVHVLSDSGEHSSEAGNLMRDETSPRNTRLTAAQCELLRSKAEANRLLRRR